jgi:hypothetical protein
LRSDGDRFFRMTPMVATAPSARPAQAAVAANESPQWYSIASISTSESIFVEPVSPGHEERPLMVEKMGVPCAAS